MSGQAAQRMRISRLATLRGHAWVMVVGALLLWFSAPALLSIYPYWAEYDYSHGYLIPPVVALLVVLEVRGAPLAPLSPSWAGLVSFLVLALVTMVAHASATLLVAQVVLPLLWIGAIWAVAGASNARRFILPLAFLYFAIPVWHLATGFLQSLTVAVVSVGIRATGFPAFIDGNLIYLPSGTFEVAGGCAGLRYAIIGPALGVFGGLLDRLRWVPIALLALFGLALALVGNWVRVFVMVLVGHVSEMQHYLVTQDHSFFGWTLFCAFMLPLFYVHRRLQPGGKWAHRDVSSGSTGDIVPWRSAVSLAACVVLVAGVWFNYRVLQNDQPPSPVVGLQAPDIPGWDRVADWEGTSRPVFVGASTQLAGRYANGEARVGAFVAHYTAQAQDREVVSFGNHPEGQAEVVLARQMDQAPYGPAMPFRELEVRDFSGGDRLVWVALRVAGESATSRFEAKVLQVLGAVRGRRHAQALVLTAACGFDCSRAREWLAQYASAAAETLFEHAEHPGLEAQTPDGRRSGSP